MRFVVADDHPLYRDAAAHHIQRLYPQVVVDQVASLGELLTLVELPGSAFSLIIMDFHMPGMSVEVLGQFVRRHSDIPVLAVSGTAHRAEIREMMRAGVRGFVPKTATGSHLAHAVQLLLAGGTSVPANMLFNLEAPGNSTHWQDSLTDRERDVLRGLIRGLANKEIGRELSLAEVTIKLHLSSVFRKMGARGRAEAAVIATKAGFS
jgi:two-component system nitrate/nitrite response regulator NarL